MTRYLVIWRIVNARQSDDPATRLKNSMKLMEMVKQAMNTGLIKEWGARLDGHMGYSILEGSDADIALSAQMFGPYFEFETHPIMDVAQYSELLNTAASAEAKMT